MAGDSEFGRKFIQKGVSEKLGRGGEVKDPGRGKERLWKTARGWERQERQMGRFRRDRE